MPLTTQQPEERSRTVRTGTDSVDVRVHMTLEDLQPQFAAYLTSPLRSRGYPAQAGWHSVLVEVAPALAIQRVTDLALKAAPGVEPGILNVERQFGVVELHAESLDEVRRASEAILAGLGVAQGDATTARLLYVDVIEDIGDMHAVLLNRTRDGSMILPGEALLALEIEPALFAAFAANEAERAAPRASLVDISMMGAAGRMYFSGTPADLERAAAAVSAKVEELSQPEAATERSGR